MATIQLGTSTTNPSNVMALGFNYGSTSNNGNLLSQTITRGSQTWAQSYGYDTLNRITCAAETPNSTEVTCNPTTVAGSGANWYRVFSADPWANEWLASNSSTPAVNSFTPIVYSNFNSSNQLTTQGATYDGAGNQTKIGAMTPKIA